MDYWIPKLKENVERDRVTDSELEAGGWQVVRVWAHVHEDEARAIVMARLNSAKDLIGIPG